VNQPERPEPDQNRRPPAQADFRFDPPPSHLRQAGAPPERAVDERALAEAALRLSQTRLRAIVESSAVGILVMDLAGRLRDANAAFQSMIGYTLEELRRLHVLELSVEEDRPGVRAAFAAILRGERKHAVLEHRHRRAGGETIWVRLTLSLVRDPDGRPELFLAVVEDITERRAAEERVRFQANLLDAVGEAVVAVDLQGRILYWNRMAELLSGWSADEVLGREFPGVTPASLLGESVEEMTARALAGGTPSAEIGFRRRDGTTFPALLSLAPVRGADGTVQGLVGVASDLTERKRLEEQLAQAQKMEAIGRLAGGIAHDFNNLLTAISGHVELLLEQLAHGDPLREDLVEIRAATTRAVDLTRQLLAFSRRQVLRPRIVQLSSIIEEMANLLRRLIGEDIRLVLDSDPQLGYVWADPGQLGQVLLNLVVNARDAMPEGGTLSIRAENTDTASGLVPGEPEPGPGPFVVLTVADTGIGMSREVQEKIFEPFFTTKEPGKGTGLGLATVYGIVKQSGGHIAVESEPGQGTTFRIFLPRVEAPAADAASHDDSTAAEAARREQVRGTILLVEDENAVRILVRKVLQRCGYTVLEAANGPDALRISAGHDEPIDLLLTDVVMPDMSGRELADRLLERNPGLRVLFMSGYTADAIHTQGVLAPDASFLEKPFLPDVLVRKVREVLEAPAGDGTTA